MPRILGETLYFRNLTGELRPAHAIGMMPALPIHLERVSPRWNISRSNRYLDE